MILYILGLDDLGIIGIYIGFTTVDTKALGFTIKANIGTKSCLFLIMSVLIGVLTAFDDQITANSDLGVRELI
ncbi:hypothetical protein AO377_1889 [Moraxella catarrhalis]|nr:hypothetical protein AO377_1889 [Moraxella catarrhalis]OAV13114.1 hypothetical protein AO375_1636 [Moraxella catarrhalis]OAV37470.1 hypothetical protein AO365_0471 [Moraxella catarrhalis]